MPALQEYSNFLFTKNEHREARTIVKTGGFLADSSLEYENACVGIELGVTGIKIALLRKKDISIELVNWGIYEFPFQLNPSNLQQNRGALEALLAKLKINKLKAALSLNNGVHLQYVAMPVFSDKEFISSVPGYFGSNYLGNGDKDIYYVKPYGITRDGSGAIVKDGIAVIVDEFYFTDMIKLIKTQPVDLVRVESSCMAVVNLFNIPVIGSEPYCLIDLGSSSVRVTIVQNNKIIYHRTVYSIDKYLTRELSEIYQIHDDLAEQIKKKMRFSGDYNVESRKVKERLFEMTEPIFNILVDEMKSTFRFFKKETGKNVNKIILTGGGALISGIDRFLHQKLKVDVEVGNFLTKLNLNESVDEKQFRSSANLLASAIGTARNELLNYNNRTINLIGGKMSKEKNVQNKVKVAAILLVVLLTGFFIKNDLKIKTQTYQKNIVMCGHILDELQQKIDSMQDSKTKIGSEVQLVGNKQAIRTSQLFRKLGNNVPTSLWLDRMKIKTEQIQSLDGLLKVVSVPRVQKKNRTIYQFEGRSVDKGAIKNFLHQIEGTAKWRKVTLTKIEWVGSNEEGIWEFTIQLIQ